MESRPKRLSEVPWNPDTLGRCFLLGAGASYAVGQTFSKEIPLDNRFFPLLQAMNPVLYGNIERILKAQFKEVAELRALTLESVEDYVAKTGDMFRARLESQLKLAIVGLLGENTGTTNGNVLVNLRGGATGGGTPNLQLYYLLLDNMAPTDYFVSLNYDILLDLAILSSNRSIDYGSRIREITKSAGWPNDRLYSVKLFKPHGSLNWDEAGRPQEVARGPPNLKIATRLSVLTDPLLQDVWKEAIFGLQKADQLIVVGSSLSKQDELLMTFISMWKSESALRKTSTRVIFANKERNEYYSSVFADLPGTLELYTDGFTEKSIEFIFKS